MAAVSESEASRYWRDKYLDLVDENDQLKNTTHATQDQMRRAIMMVSLLAEGQSSGIDTALKNLRNTLKENSPLRHAVDDLNHAILTFEDTQTAHTEVLLGLISDAAQKLSLCPLPRALLKRVRSVQQSAELELRDWSGYSDQLKSWLQIAGEIATLEGHEEARSSWWQRWFKPKEDPAKTITTDEPSAIESIRAEPGFSEIAGDVTSTLENLLGQIVVPETLQMQLLSLQERLQAGLHWNELVPLLEDTSTLLLQCLSNSQLEIEQFLTTLDARLATIQTLVTEASGDQGSRSSARQELDSVVRSQLADISSVLTGENSLGALGERVNEHLSLILRTMEKYQSEEFEREKLLSARLDQLQARVTEMESEISRTRFSLEETRRRALIDHLTGLPNRDAYHKRLEHELQRKSLHNTPLTMVITDVDYFKRINDTFGHLAGDKVLRLIARAMRASLREVDFIARYGGEEFVILMPEIDIDGALIVAERLRLAIEQSPFNFRKERVPITVSLGLSQFKPNESGDMVFERADRALYQAKEQGRNRCVVA